MINTGAITAIIIEDEKIIREMLTHAVAALDCQVVGTAEDGIAAVTLFEEKQPDLVLLDIMMPEINGVEVLGRIRQADPDAYVVMVTSLDDEQIVEDCMIAGARDYIRKDTRTDRVVSRLEKHVLRLRGG